MHMRRGFRAAFVGIVGVAGMVLGVGPSTAAAAPAPAASGVRSCATESRPGFAACTALRRTDRASVTHMAAGAITPNALPAGFGPADLLSAYKLPANGGAGQTVAIVDA